MTPDIDIDVGLVGPQPRAVRWGPIWAGLLTSFGVFLLLTLLAVGIGIQQLSGQDADLAATVTASIIGLVSLVAGGFVASWSAVQSDGARGLLYGFLVWALWIFLIVLLGTFGLGQLLGTFGGLLTNLQGDVSQQEIIDAVQTGSLQSFLALALTATAAMLGGAIGAFVITSREEAADATVVD
jgi:hypothetical protein